MSDGHIDAEDWLAAQPAVVHEIADQLMVQWRERMTLQQARASVAMTQVEVAAALGVTQDRVSKLERSRDARISTLKRHVEALGGRLRFIVEFPDRPPIAISFGDEDEAPGTDAGAD